MLFPSRRDGNKQKKKKFAFITVEDVVLLDSTLDLFQVRFTLALVSNLWFPEVNVHFLPPLRCMNLPSFKVT